MKLRMVTDDATDCEIVAVTDTLLTGAAANARQISAVPRCAFVRTTSCQFRPAPGCPSRWSRAARVVGGHERQEEFVRRRRRESLRGDGCCVRRLVAECDSIDCQRRCGCHGDLNWGSMSSTFPGSVAGARGQRLPAERRGRRVPGDRIRRRDSSAPIRRARRREEQHACSRRCRRRRSRTRPPRHRKPWRCRRERVMRTLGGARSMLVTFT